MRIDYGKWILLSILAILITIAAKYYAYFPGDVAIERFVQSQVSKNLNWAIIVSRSAEFPWVLIILAFVFAISWIVAGRRAALVSLLSFAGMLALGIWLGSTIARPRPSPNLVHVFQRFSGYSFPSQFALRYAATFGFLGVLAAWKGSGVLRTTLLIGSCVLLLLGWTARVALGAHWPSDVIISYYFGILWAAFLIRFFLMAYKMRGKMKGGTE